MPISVSVILMGVLELRSLAPGPSYTVVSRQNWATPQTSCLAVDLSFLTLGGPVSTRDIGGNAEGTDQLEFPLIPLYGLKNAFPTFLLILLE